MQHLAESNEDEDRCQPAEEQEAPGAVGAWGLGSGTMPLSPELMCEPPFTLDLQQEVEDWLLRLGELVAHDPCSLPFGSNTDYDEPCFPGACRSNPHFDQALSLLRALERALRSGQPQMPISLSVKELMSRCTAYSYWLSATMVALGGWCFCDWAMLLL